MTGRKATAVTSIAVAGFLSGCGADAPVEIDYRGVPDGLEMDPLNEDPAGVWLERGRTFAIVTMGSSSCPPVAKSVTASSRQGVTVVFGPSPNDLCTADMAPTTHEFDMPDEVGGYPVTVEILFEDWAQKTSITLD